MSTTDSNTKKTLNFLLLAAGLSSRFYQKTEQHKLLYHFNGKAIIAHTLENIAPLLSPEQSLLVVTGHQEKEINQTIAASHISDYQTCFCPDYALGLGHSLAHGVDVLNKSADALVILLADQIAVTTADLTRLIDAYLNCAQPDKTIAASHFDDATSPPIIIPKMYWPELARLKGDRGAGGIVKAAERNQHLIKIAMPNAALDIDLPTDLDKL